MRRTGNPGAVPENPNYLHGKEARYLYTVYIHIYTFYSCWNGRATSFSKSSSNQIILTMDHSPQPPRHHRELFALTAWLQTFPEFELVDENNIKNDTVIIHTPLYDGHETPADAERITRLLSSSMEVAWYVWCDVFRSRKRKGFIHSFAHMFVSFHSSSFLVVIVIILFNPDIVPFVK